MSENKKFLSLDEILKDLNETFVYFHIYDKNNISVIDIKDFKNFKKLWNDVK